MVTRGAAESTATLPIQLHCDSGHRLTLTTIPHLHKCHCNLCRSDIPRTTTRYNCRWCMYNVCYECSMQFNIRTERSRKSIRKGTMRTMFRSRVDEKQNCRELSVAISKYYDIVNPSVGEMRVHCHSRKGLCIAEDCHFAAFSAAKMELTSGIPVAATQISSVDATGREIAEAVVRRGMQLVDVVGAEVGRQFDCSDKRWRPTLPEAPPGTSMLAWLLGGGNLLQKIRSLCQAAEEVLRTQPVVSEVSVPAKVFGDIHGQLRDMLLLFHFYGRPGGDAVVGRMQSGTRARMPARSESNISNHTSPSFAPDLRSVRRMPSGVSGDSSGSSAAAASAEPGQPPVSYVFNGDWVDRGRHQLEVIVLLFALKVLCPNSVWLNRGNHEDAGQNLKTSRKGSLGFDKACEAQFGAMEGLAVFSDVHRVFDWLPLAARLGQKILVLHGGLGGGDWTLDELRQVQRPLNTNDLATALGGAVYNVLWSDPLAPDRRNPVQTYGVHPSHRAKHSSVMKGFGRDVTERFCAREQLGLIIRSHQFKQSGKGYELHHDGWLMRVFSARNYCGESSNDGGLLLIGMAAGSPGTLLVRPQNLERMTRPCFVGPGLAEPVDEPLPEPYCQRGHLMQLVEPRPPSGWLSLSRLCGERKANAECNRCGAEQLEAGRFYYCRGCCDYDLCFSCARQDARSSDAGHGQERRLDAYRAEQGAESDSEDVESTDGSTDGDEPGARRDGAPATLLATMFRQKLDRGSQGAKADVDPAVADERPVAAAADRARGLAVEGRAVEAEGEVVEC